MNNKLFLFSLLGLLALIPVQAHAINLEINNRSGFYVDFEFNGTAPAGALAGEFGISLGNFTSAAYCIELGIEAGSGDAAFIDPDNYSYFSGSSLQEFDKNGLYAAWLMDQYATGFGFDFYSKRDSLPDQYLGGSLDKDALDKDIADAALQIALWETLYIYNKNDNTYSGDYFQNTVFNNTPHHPAGKDDGDSSTIADGNREQIAWALAEIYKNDLQTTRASSNNGLSDLEFSGKYKFYIAEITSENGIHRQNLLVAKPIPEPATIVLFGIGLLGITAIGRKRI